MALLQAHHGRCLQDISDTFDTLFILRFTVSENQHFDLSIILTWSSVLLWLMELNCQTVDDIKKYYQCAGAACNDNTCVTHKNSCYTWSSVSLVATVCLACALLCMENQISFPLYTHQFKKSATRFFFNLHNESVLMPPIYCLGSQENNQLCSGF